jgi:hypothetical protein
MTSKKAPILYFVQPLTTDLVVRPTFPPIHETLVDQSAYMAALLSRGVKAARRFFGDLVSLESGRNTPTRDRESGVRAASVAYRGVTTSADLIKGDITLLAQR